LEEEELEVQVTPGLQQQVPMVQILFLEVYVQSVVAAEAPGTITHTHISVLREIPVDLVEVIHVHGAAIMLIKAEMV
jgi:hypothetical protein